MYPSHETEVGHWSRRALYAYNGTEEGIHYLLANNTHLIFFYKKFDSYETALLNEENLQPF